MFVITMFPFFTFVFAAASDDLILSYKYNEEEIVIDHYSFNNQKKIELLAKSYSGEDEEGDSELKYLEMMRKIRDENPDLFEKIKKLPKKARSGFKKENIEIEQLVTFFRIGKLKKFYINQSGKSNEITFFDAVKELECTPLTKRANIPDEYFHLLQTNKSKFEIDTTIGDEPLKSSGGRSNAAYIERRLKDRSFKNCKTFTDSDDEFINAVKDMLNQGTMAKKTAQIIKKEFERTTDPLEILNILRKNIRAIAIEQNSNNKKFQNREVILSGYIIK